LLWIKATPRHTQCRPPPETPWSTPFDDPISPREGRRLTTLQHAADYIMQLPEDIEKQERWQIAVENLINTAEIGGGWLMFSRIAMMRALNEKQRQRKSANRRPIGYFAGSYFSDVLTVLNLPLRLVPIPLTAARITMLRPVAIRQYSIAVAPDSLLRNLENKCRIQNSG
jgi:hypothetical protein